jgi:2-polyprenyl-6-methoxyphenol hydroxylase-like FAD-dependent oxidoreductase
MMGQGGCMAMEDAFVLAEVLGSAPNLETALDTYISRRKPRIDWVRQQSRVAGESLRLPSETRNAVLRARGDQMMQERYTPLVPAP